MEYKDFTLAVATQILTHFTNREKTMAGLDEKSIIDMVSEYKNEYGEYDVKYPQFSISIQDMFYDNFTVEASVEKLLPGVQELVWGQLGAM